MGLIAHYPLDEIKTFNETHTGDWYISEANESFSFDFSGIPEAIQDSVKLKIQQNDLEAYIDIEINGELVVDGVNGTDATTEWNEWTVPASALEEGRNIVRIFHNGGSADWGHIYDVNLYSDVPYIEDKSINDYNGIVHGTITTEQGKINQCISLDGTANTGIELLQSSDAEKYQNIFSISAWFKSNSASGSDGARIISRDASDFWCWYLYQSQTFPQDLRFYYSDTQNALISNSIQDGWNHLVSIWDLTKNEVKMYVNNTLEFETSSFAGFNTSARPIVVGGNTEGDGDISGNEVIGNVDDIKIYDHALSVKEIQELSKAKVLHYTFDDFQEPTENEFYANWGDLVSGDGILQSGAIDPFGGTDYNIYRKDGKVRFGIIDGTDIGTLYYGNTYTFSIYLRKVIGTTEPTSMEFDICDRSNSTNFSVSELDYTWKRFWVTAYHDNNSNYHFLDVGSVGVFEWCCPQIEEKDHVTPFTSTSRTGIVNDSSGYNNDADLALTTTPAWTSSSYLGKGAYEFDGIDQYIDFGTSKTFSINEWTVSGWIKPYDLSEIKSLFSAGNYNANSNWLDIYESKIAIWIHQSITNRGWHTGTTVLQNNNWYFFAYSYDNNGTYKIYVNGELENTIVVDTQLDNLIIQRIGVHSLNDGTLNDRWLNGTLDDIRFYSELLSDDEVKELYQTRAQVDKNGNLSSNQLIETGHRPLMLDYTIWENGQTGSVGSFNDNGSASENHRILGADPWGKETIIWKALPDSTSGADGGWSHYADNIDQSKMYRFSTWVYRNDVNNGNFYIGTGGYNSSGSNIGVKYRGSTSTTTNPYFYVSSTGITPFRWELIVGHVWPYNSGDGSDHPDSGRYTIDGKYANISRDYVWLDGTVRTRHRSYLYYCTDTNQRQYWVYPRLDVIDGTEPSIDDLLAGFDSRNIEYIREKGGTSNISLDVGKQLTRTGEISELGPTNGLVAWYPLNGDAYDYTEDNNDGTVNGATVDAGLNQLCYSFDGSASRIINTDVFLSSDPVFTLTGWFKRTGDWKGKGSWGIGSSGNAISSYQNYASDRIGFDEWGSTTFYTSETIPLDEWTFIVWVKSNTGIFSTSILDIYINGNLATLNTARDGNITANVNSGFSIGGIAYNNTSYDLSSQIQDVRIYNRALTPEEINILYTLTNNSETKMKMNKYGIYTRGNVKEN